MKKPLYYRGIVIACIICFVLTPMHVVVNAITGDEIKDVEKDIEYICKYFEIDDDGEVTYNRGAAIEDGISLEMLDFADQIYAFGESQSVEKEEIAVLGSNKIIKAAKAKAVAFPVYGNWCGPYYPKKNRNPKPIDLLDKGCKNHDVCYDQIGRHKCACDKTFLSYINRTYNRMSGTKQRSMARVIKAWLQIKSNNVTKNGGNFACKK